MARIRNSVPPGDNLPIVCVLEDVPYRVEWLEENFPDIHVAWSTTVEDFCASLDTMAMTGRLVLILLDHDLGLNPLDQATNAYGDDWNYMEDRDGNDGRDACWAMTVYPQVPVFIWSANFEMAPVMEEILRQRGYSRVSRRSFDDYRSEVAQYIKNAIGS